MVDVDGAEFVSIDPFDSVLKNHNTTLNYGSLGQIKLTPVRKSLWVFHSHRRFLVTHIKTINFTYRTFLHFSSKTTHHGFFQVKLNRIKKFH